MMIELLRKRRSIRVFKEEEIEPGKIEILKESLLRSPSSRNINPWEFIFIDKRELLKKLSTAKEHGAEFLDGATLGLVICGDERLSDVWVEDCSIASIIVQITAESIGLGSCWVQIRNRMHDEKVTSEEYVQKVLNIPKTIRVESIIGIGYPVQKKQGIPKERLQYEKIRMNHY